MLRYQPLIAPRGFEETTSAPGVTLIRNDPRRRRGAHLILVLARHGVLVLSDLSALLLASLVGYVAWAGLVLHQPPGPYFSLLPLLSLFPLAYLFTDLYPGFGLGAVEILRRLSYCTSISFLGVAAASFALKADPLFSRMTFVFTWAAALVLVPVSRLFTLSMVKSFQWWGEPTVIFGTRSEARLTINLAQKRTIAWVRRGRRALLRRSSGGPDNRGCPNPRWSGTRPRAFTTWSVNAARLGRLRRYGSAG